VKRKSKSLGRPRREERAHAQHHHNQEEQRHQDFRKFLNAFLNAAHNHKVRHEHEHSHIDDGFPRPRHHFAEVSVPVGRAVGAESQRSDQIVERPARHHDVVAQDEPSDEHAKLPDVSPEPAAAQPLIGLRRIGVRRASHDKLGRHERESDEQDARNINNEESAAAALAGLGREAPNVAQSDGAAGCGENHADFAAKISSRIIRTHL